MNDDLTPPHWIEGPTNTNRITEADIKAATDCDAWVNDHELRQFAGAFRAHREDAYSEVIQHVGSVARAIGAQAGVGAMETAGAIVSFLYANPHYLVPFMTSEKSPVDWPDAWHRAGGLSWHGMDGKLHWPGELEVKQ